MYALFLSLFVYKHISVGLHSFPVTEVAKPKNTRLLKIHVPSLRQSFLAYNRHVNYYTIVKHKQSYLSNDQPFVRSANMMSVLCRRPVREHTHLLLCFCGVQLLSLSFPNASWYNSLQSYSITIIKLQ